MTTVAEGATRNGVNTDVLFGTLDAISERPELGRFQFRVRNRWLGGAHNRSAVKGLYGAGQEDTSREEPFHIDAGEPPVLLGANEGPNPAEAYLFVPEISPFVANWSAITVDSNINYWLYWLAQNYSAWLVVGIALPVLVCAGAAVLVIARNVRKLEPKVRTAY